MFTSRFSSGLILLEYTKGFKRYRLHLRGALFRCVDPFLKNTLNRFKVGYG